MYTEAAHEIVGSPAWYAGLAVIVFALTVLAVLRWQQPDGRVVVVRRSRVVRVPARRVLAVVPLLEQARAWPADLLELPMEVREFTRDGHEVRVLVELVVWVPPPRVGEEYADPLPVLDCAARELVAGAVRARTAPGLVDRDDGLPAALGGACLRGAHDRTIGVVATVDVAEVDLLLTASGGTAYGHR